MNYSPIEVKVREATNGDEQWGPHGTLMAEIAKVSVNLSFKTGFLACVFGTNESRQLTAMRSTASAWTCSGGARSRTGRENTGAAYTRYLVNSTDYYLHF